MKAKIAVSREISRLFRKRKYAFFRKARRKPKKQIRPVRRAGHGDGALGCLCIGLLGGAAEAAFDRRTRLPALN